MKKTLIKHGRRIGVVLLSSLLGRDWFYGLIGILNKYVLNLTKKGALSEYIPYFWPGVVVLNEVYPEPGKSEVAAIQAKGGCCYHIAGSKDRPGRLSRGATRAASPAVPLFCRSRKGMDRSSDCQEDVIKSFLLHEPPKFLY
jgi:hypothetical protein